MDNRSLKISFAVGVGSSLAAGLATAVAAWLLSESWSVVALVCIGFALVLAYFVRRSYLELRSIVEEALRRADEPDLERVTFVPRMSGEEARNRIKSATNEIWSFQISGSEFTANSIETYEAWLTDRNRRLLIAFANPENTELLKSIVKLSGQGKQSSEDHEYETLRRRIRKTLTMYIELREKLGAQVDVRVYDFSPPYSIHAVDPDDPAAASLFIELYLPDLESADRPCMLLPYEHEKFSMYMHQSLAWFEAGVPAKPSS